MDLTGTTVLPRKWTSPGELSLLPRDKDGVVRGKDKAILGAYLRFKHVTLALLSGKEFYTTAVPLFNT